MATHNYFIGLMSGTSMDAIDAVLVDFATPKPNMVATHSEPISVVLKDTLLSLAKTSNNEIHVMSEVDQQMGRAFANTSLNLIKKAQLTAADITAIGCHGQTIRHQPDFSCPYTLQIGDPNIIAAETGVTTIADFRRRDIAEGGKGAPFAPAFHAVALHSTSEHRAVVNIGGIANITVLKKGKAKIAHTGFDTGPGNMLMDAWIQTHHNQAFDDSGAWASGGQVNASLLAHLLEEAYFKLPPPKSTGRELFHLDWLMSKLTSFGQTLAPVDVQATLMELTAHTIIDAIHTHAPDTQQLFVCGGGAYNIALLQRLSTLAAPITVQTTDALGISPKWLEAMMFAWFAKQRLDNTPIDLTRITGAKRPVVLGGVYAR